ncbi:MAG: pilus assembly protein [Rhizobiaceae bacterium]|nr:pilus assembly protein [Rhizobiaceae bacterium]
MGREETGQGKGMWRQALRRFRRDRSGSTAIEFTALAIPFALLVFAILETCISFAGQEVLANATDDVARQIRTGQVKKSELDSSKLHDMICDRLEVIVATGCPGLVFDLKEYPTFAAAAKEHIKFTSDGDIDTSGFGVTPGAAMSKNMLRVFYRWPVITDLMRRSMSSLKGGYTLHFAAVTWQNEPFDD